MEKFRKRCLIFFALFQVGYLNAFVLKQLKVDNDILHQLSSCDRKSERIGRSFVAKQLGTQLKRNELIEAKKHIEKDAITAASVAIKNGDITVERTLPGATIDTGHSCQWRAKAKHGKMTLKMTREIQKLYILDDEDYEEDFQTASDQFGNKQPSEYTTIITGIVETEAHLKTEIEVRKGQRLGKCHKLWQKTCQSSAVAIGNMGIDIDLVATGFEITSHPGKLCFNIDYTATAYNDETHWRPFEVSSSESCNLVQIFGLTLSSMNSRIDRYANTYVKQDEIRKINSTGLTETMERVMEARMGSLVCVDLVEENGTLFKNSAKFSKSGSATCPRQCPDDFTLLSSRGVCQKSLGRNKSNCPGGSYLYEKKRGRRTYYYCQIDI